jgi:hypothetical protein
MARVENPYRPGFNEMPGELAGRDEILEALLDAVEVAALDKRMPRPTLLVGSRGVGKTVLLAEAASIAGSRFGWPRVHLEIRPGTPFTATLIDALQRAHDLVDPPSSNRSLRADSATVRAGLPGIGGELRFARVEPLTDPAIALRRALTGLVGAVLDRDSGFVLTIDEAQLANRDELSGLTALLQEGVGERWPVVVVAAGLPLMRERDHLVTYFERGAWFEPDVLAPADTLRALQVPAQRAGRPMQDDAARVLADASGGYPYAVQLYGHHAWRTSTGKPTIDLAAANDAAPRAARELARSLYASRWTAASPVQREYLAAAAELSTTGPITARAVADRLGKTTKQLSTVREDLIKGGSLTVHGDELRFTVPGMSQYVRSVGQGRAVPQAMRIDSRPIGSSIDSPGR